MLLNCGAGEGSWESPWTAGRSNQSILKEINPEYSLEGLMLKLKFQYFGHLMQRADSLEKTLMLGQIEGKRRRGWQDEMVDGITDAMYVGLSKFREIMKNGEWRAIVHGLTKSRIRLSDWITTNTSKSGLCLWEPWDFARLQCLQAEKTLRFVKGDLKLTGNEKRDWVYSGQGRNSSLGSEPK